MNTIYGRIVNPVDNAQSLLYMRRPLLKFSISGTKTDHGSEMIPSTLFKREGMTAAQISEMADNTYVKVLHQNKPIYLETDIRVTYICKMNKGSLKPKYNATKEVPIVNENMMLVHGAKIVINLIVYAMATSNTLHCVIAVPAST
jgi:hypothetical protein